MAVVMAGVAAVMVRSTLGARFTLLPNCLMKYDDDMAGRTDRRHADCAWPDMQKSVSEFVDHRQDFLFGLWPLIDGNTAFGIVRTGMNLDAETMAPKGRIPNLSAVASG